VIAAGRLDEVVPIEPASMPKRRVVQWDKEDCADLGIIRPGPIVGQMVSPYLRRRAGGLLDVVGRYA